MGIARHNPQYSNSYAFPSKHTCSTLDYSSTKYVVVNANSVLYLVVPR